MCIIIHVYSILHIITYTTCIYTIDKYINSCITHTVCGWWVTRTTQSLSVRNVSSLCCSDDTVCVWWSWWWGDIGGDKTHNNPILGYHKVHWSSCISMGCVMNSCPGDPINEINSKKCYKKATKNQKIYFSSFFYVCLATYYRRVPGLPQQRDEDWDTCTAHYDRLSLDQENWRVLWVETRGRSLSVNFELSMAIQNGELCMHRYRFLI